MAAGSHGKRWWSFALALVLSVALPAWAMNVYGLAVHTDHSRFRTSDSVEDARQRGVLVRLPELEDSVFPYAGQPLRVREVWVEEITQVRYHWYLPGTGHEVGLGRYRLMVDLVLADGAPLPSQDRYHLSRELCATAGAETISGIGDRGDDTPFSAALGERIPQRMTFHAGPPVCPKRKIGEGL